MGVQHTSVPRWPAGPVDVDPAARDVGLVGFGDDGAAVVAGWSVRAPSAAVVLARRADAATLAALESLVSRARVGWRLMLAGPEDDVLAARAAAVRGGLLDAELRVQVTGAARKRVYCAHCRTTSEGDAPVGGELPCGGCGRPLHVYGHVSRRLGAYLGFAADAEELP